MNLSENTLQELARTQQLLLALTEDLDEATLRRQMHPDLSALGWHLGHCTFTECYWLHEVVRGDDRVTRPLQALYEPPNTPKPERGYLIPAKEALLDWVRSLQEYNRDWLAGPAFQWGEHPLMQNEYLPRFLIQHHAQHYETMLMALTQQQLHTSPAEYSTQTPLRATALCRDAETVPGGHYRIGGQAPDAFDNELPLQHAELSGYRIARHPVSNGAYLAFMEDAAYRRPALWDAAGNAWRQDHVTQEAPDHWRQDPAGNWYGIGLRGPYDLGAEAPVMGVNHHEAVAFARWAEAHLPHEYQWETAQRLQLLQNTGQVWEWCSNHFMPYAGFQPFPYEEYSTPWFDDQHFSLRGGSLYTQPRLKRASFRNFYQASKNHIFAGIRLVF